MADYGEPVIVDASPDKEFSHNVAKLLNITPHDVNVAKFADSDVEIKISPSVRGKDVYVLQQYIPDIGTRFYELLNTVSATQTGGEAGRVTVVMPYCFGMRGERATGPRQSIQANVVAGALKAMGVDKVVTIGLHTEAVSSIFLASGVKLEHLSFEPLAANYIANKALEKGYHNVRIASPDVGGSKRAHRTIQLIQETHPQLNTDMVIGYKHRQGANKTKHLATIGDVEGKPVFLYDDIGDTMGTIAGAAEAFQQAGAKELYVILIHPVMGNGYEKNLDKLCHNPAVKEITFGNTIPLKTQHPKIKTIPVEPFIAETIKRINQNHSMSKLHQPAEIINLYENSTFAFNGQHVTISKQPGKVAQKPLKEY